MTRNAKRQCRNDPDPSEEVPVPSIPVASAAIVKRKTQKIQNITKNKAFQRLLLFSVPPRINIRLYL